MSLNQKIINLLTICRRAGKTVIGFDAVCAQMKLNKVFCVLLAADVSPKTKKEIDHSSPKRIVCDRVCQENAFQIRICRRESI